MGKRERAGFKPAPTGDLVGGWVIARVVQVRDLDSGFCRNDGQKGIPIPSAPHRGLLPSCRSTRTGFSQE